MHRYEEYQECIHSRTTPLCLSPVTLFVCLIVSLYACRVLTHTYICIHIYASVFYICMNTYIYIYICMYIYLDLYTCFIYMSMHVRIHRDESYTHVYIIYLFILKKKIDTCTHA